MQCLVACSPVDNLDETKKPNGSLFCVEDESMIDDR